MLPGDRQVLQNHVTARQPTKHAALLGIVQANLEAAEHLRWCDGTSIALASASVWAGVVCDNGGTFKVQDKRM